MDADWIRMWGKGDWRRLWNIGCLAACQNCKPLGEIGLSIRSTTSAVDRPGGVDEDPGQARDDPGGAEHAKDERPVILAGLCAGALQESAGKRRSKESADAADHVDGSRERAGETAADVRACRPDDRHRQIVDEEDN